MFGLAHLQSFFLCSVSNIDICFLSVAPERQQESDRWTWALMQVLYVGHRHKQDMSLQHRGCMCMDNPRQTHTYRLKIYRDYICMSDSQLQIQYTHLTQQQMQHITGERLGLIICKYSHRHSHSSKNEKSQNLLGTFAFSPDSGITE